MWTGGVATGVNAGCDLWYEHYKMMVPTLKRIKVSSEEALTSWLSQHRGAEDCVMLVTYSDASSAKHVSRERVADALAAHGWVPGARYTLNGSLLGHVIRKGAAWRERTLNR